MDARARDLQHRHCATISNSSNIYVRRDICMQGASAISVSCTSGLLGQNDTYSQPLTLETFYYKRQSRVPRTLSGYVATIPAQVLVLF